MAEGKRRSEVTPFVHKTEYSKAPRLLQQSLFQTTLREVKQEWNCICKSGTIPPTDSVVLVRVHAGEKPNVLLGNQVVAEIADIQSDDLTEALCNDAQADGVVIAVVSETTSSGQFTIKLVTDQ